MSGPEMTVPCKGYAITEVGGTFKPFEFNRRKCGPTDVQFDIKYAGICHSDIHTARGEWGPPILPLIPGHELGGVVTAVGEDVTDFKVGDVVGVGCMVDSCRNCSSCMAGDEQYCATGAIFTYNSKAKYTHCAEYTADGGLPTYGGYSKSSCVDQKYVVKIPKNLDLAAATPLLCAGITVYSPMIHFNLKPHHKFGVVGLGGLGHMAVKLGVAFGCHTSVISRGTGKKEDSMKNLKAHGYVDSKNPDEMKAAAGTFDFIICTVSAEYTIADYLSLLKTDGKFVVVGAPPTPLALPVFSLIPTRKSIAGSLIGGIKETQEMLDFCGRHNITCDIETISADKINEAYDRTMAADVKYRFVIDCSTI